MAMVNTPVRQQKRGSLIAGIGALVGIGAFLLLPYLNITVTVTNNNGFSNPQTNSVAFPVGTGFISVFSGLIWVEGLLAIAVLVLAALVMWRDVPFGASTTPVEVQIRRAAYAMLLLGAAGIAFQFLFTSIGNGQINNLPQSITIGTFSLADLLTRSNQSLSATMGYAIGSWIYLIGMCVAILGGVLMLRTGTVPVSSPQTISPPPGWQQYPPYQQTQQQSWPQPSQSQPVWQQPPQPPQPQQGWQQPPTQGWQQPPNS
jgi:hypothetical protein